MARIGRPTTIVIPSSALPQDYSVDVTGGQVVSPILVIVNVENAASVRSTPSAAVRELT